MIDSSHESDLYFYKFSITRVVDGDTVYGVAGLGFGICMDIKVRLWGINTPELRGSEREAGLKAKYALIDLLLDKDSSLSGKYKQCYIHTIKDKQGKYGRWLGVIYLAGLTGSVNKWLVDEGYAVEKFY